MTRPVTVGVARAAQAGAIPRAVVSQVGTESPVLTDKVRRRHRGDSGTEG